MILGRHKSTISREIHRNTGLRGYRPRQAQLLTEQRRFAKALPHISELALVSCRHFAERRLEVLNKSVFGSKRNMRSLLVMRWIYQYILQDKAYGGDLYRHLRCQKKRRKRYGSYNRRGQLIDRISIDERPSIVESRSRIGDWELDTIIGKNHKQAIVSLTERKTRYTLIQKVKRKTAESVSNAIITLLSPFSDRVITMTSDNGKEFAEHKKIARKLKAKFYFAHPYSSWERGLNENTNGLIRQYFPKGSDFTNITQKEINRAMNKLNNRPRKCLGIKTPNQVFLGINPSVALVS